MVAHAYSHLIGSTVGVLTDGWIVAATVMTPEIGQNDNDLLVLLADGEWRTIRYMDTYRSDFIDAR